MDKYTPEKLELEAALVEECGLPYGDYRHEVAAILRAYAATLRQQAGRVDEGMVERAREAYFNAANVKDGVFTDPVAMRAALTAALAQNTQGDAIDPAANWPEDAGHENGDYECVCASCGRHFIGYKRRVTCRLCHAERARVPEGMVLVPREPTPEMIEAGNAEYEKALLGNRRNVSAAFNRKWAAMLAAAPSQRAEAMTSERGAFEKWARGEGYALAKQDDNSYHGIGIRNAWEGWQARAHLAQPAQAVDVGESFVQAMVQFHEHKNRVISGEKAGPVGDGWQPIDSAPKDGTRIMLSNGHGAWMAEYQPVFPSGYRPSSPWSSAMLNHEHMPLAGRHKAPSHWMPLPASPTPGKEGA